MTYDIEITYKPNPSSEEIQVLYDGIAGYAEQKNNQPPIECYGFFVYDNDKKIIAGCNGSMYYGSYAMDKLLGIAPGKTCP